MTTIIDNNTLKTTGNRLTVAAICAAFLLAMTPPAEANDTVITLPDEGGVMVTTETGLAATVWGHCWDSSPPHATITITGTHVTGSYSSTCLGGLPDDFVCGENICGDPGSGCFIDGIVILGEYSAAFVPTQGFWKITFNLQFADYWGTC